MLSVDCMLCSFSQREKTIYDGFRFPVNSTDNRIYGSPTSLSNANFGYLTRITTGVQSSAKFPTSFFHIFLSRFVEHWGGDVRAIARPIKVFQVPKFTIIGRIRT